MRRGVSEKRNEDSLNGKTNQSALDKLKARDFLKVLRSGNLGSRRESASTEAGQDFQGPHCHNDTPRTLRRNQKPWSLDPARRCCKRDQDEGAVLLGLLALGQDESKRKVATEPRVENTLV